MQKERILSPQPGCRYGLGDWHTHITLLASALFKQRPQSILEMGIGDYSTALIHAYVHNNPGTRAWSLENDFHDGWYSGLKWMDNGDNHHVVKVPDWDFSTWPNQHYDFIFIDQGPECDRIPALEWSRSHGDVVMIHDCNYPERYSSILDKFDYVLHDRTHRFNTTVASTKHDVTEWL